MQEDQAELLKTISSFEAVFDQDNRIYRRCEAIRHWRSEPI